MQKIKYIILGAGPSGLAFARTIQTFTNDFLILEKEETAGGLCRSIQTPYGMADLGGGHMFATKYADANTFVKKHLPDSEWLTFERNSTLVFQGHEINYPIEEHLWQLPEEKAISIIYEILTFEHNETPQNFEEWVIKKFGPSISKDYMLPYNKKLWGEPLDRLALTWLHKLPSPDPKIILRSILNQKQDRNALFHNKWQYPKSGGFQRMTDAIAEPVKNNLICNYQIKKIRTNSNGTVINDEYEAEYVINTIPWRVWEIVSDAPVDVKAAMQKLEAVPLTVALVEPSSRNSPQWTYYPDMDVEYHRKFFTAQWMPGSKFDFTETNSSRYSGQIASYIKFENEFAYPIYTHDRESSMNIINSWATKLNILPLGRWGTWDYANSDVCIHLSLVAASKQFNTSIDELLGKM